MTEADLSTKSASVTPAIHKEPEPEPALPPWLFPVTMAISMTTFLVISFALHHRRFLLKRRRLYQHNCYVLRHRRVAGPVSLARYNKVHNIEKPFKKLWGSKKLRRAYSWSPRFLKHKEDSSRQELHGELSSPLTNVQEVVETLRKQAPSRFSRLSTRRLNKSAKPPSPLSPDPDKPQVIVPTLSDQLSTRMLQMNTVGFSEIPSVNVTLSPDTEHDVHDQVPNDECESPNFLKLPEIDQTGCNGSTPLESNLDETLQLVDIPQDIIPESHSYALPLAAILQKTFGALRCHLNPDTPESVSPARSYCVNNSLYTIPSSEQSAIDVGHARDVNCERENALPDVNAECEVDIRALQSSANPNTESHSATPTQQLAQVQLPKRRRSHSGSGSNIPEKDQAQFHGMTNMYVCNCDQGVCTNSPSSTGNGQLMTDVTFSTQTNDSNVFKALQNLSSLFFTSFKHNPTDGGYAQVFCGDEELLLGENPPWGCGRCIEARKILSALNMNSQRHISQVNKVSDSKTDFFPKSRLVFEYETGITQEDLVDKADPDMNTNLNLCEKADSTFITSKESTSSETNSLESAQCSSAMDYLDSSLTSLHDIVS